MKKVLLSFSVVLLLASCSGNKPEDPVQKPVPPEVSMGSSEEKTINIPADKLASDKDPVCGMSVAGSIADTMTYQGKLYGFCGEGCKESFKEDPKQYVKE